MGGGAASSSSDKAPGSPMKKKARRLVVSEGYDGPELEERCINTIRVVSAEQPAHASSGHPGAPMGMAPIAHLLWIEVMSYSPSRPRWMNRDRFVLSNGHACALQYTMLHLSGYGLTVQDLKNFRSVGGRTPGHPESFCTPGVEVCTGPLGQGITNAVGLAIAEKHLAATYNTPQFPVFDHYTYVLCGDGCLQEGISSEASSLAGHLGLGKLIMFYDDNQITIDGSTELSFTEDVLKRYEAYGWHIQTVTSVHRGIKELRAAVAAAQAVTDRPSIIKVRTTIGFGSRDQGKASTHGAPLDEDDLADIKIRFGMDPHRSFQIDDDVKELYDTRTKFVETKRGEWENIFENYSTSHPDKAAEIHRRFSHELPSEGVLDRLPTFDYERDEPLATRKYSEQCLDAIAGNLPELMGGSADLTGSNNTALKCTGDFQKDTPAGRYLRFGVREHGMAGICNGLFAHGGIRPFGATFLNFAGYALGAIRLSALSKFGVLYIMTHDSIGLGEDGPTHQPVEMLESLRAMPNLTVFRPADANEMSAAYKVALEQVETPTVICCTRSTVPPIRASTLDKASKGAYIAWGEGETNPHLIFVATGSEVGPCLEAAKNLSAADNMTVVGLSKDDPDRILVATDDEKMGTGSESSLDGKDMTGVNIRVVSMPCQELFLRQSEEYQRSILPGNIPTLSVEAGSVNGWHRFSHAQIGMNRFGMSGKGEEVLELFGFSANHVQEKGLALLQFYESRNVPDLMDRPIFQTIVHTNAH